MPLPGKFPGHAHYAKLQQGIVSVFDEDLCRRTVFAHNWARSHHVGLERVIWQPELAAAAEATAMAQGTDDAPV